MKPKIDYSLYLVTDRELIRTPSLEIAVEQAIIGGCTLVQLREKEIASSEFHDTAVKIKAITDRYQIPLIINDNVDIALAVDAAGVHIGQNDAPAKTVRKMIGDNKILGVSVSTPSEAVQAKKDGADYLGVGAMFATQTKKDAEQVTIETLKEIQKTVDLPVVAIGGIDQRTAPFLAETGIDGIAVVSAILSQENIPSATAELKKLFLHHKER